MTVESTYAQFCESAVELRVGTDLHADLPAPLVLGIEYDTRRLLVPDTPVAPLYAWTA